MQRDHIKKLQITFNDSLVVHDFSFEDYLQETDESGAGMFIPFNISILGIKFPGTQASTYHEPHTPLTRAVYEHNLVQTEDLLKHGASPNEPNYDGQTPLSIAARLGSVTLCKLLLEHGASFKPVLKAPGGIPYQYIAQQENVLYAAVTRGHIEIVKLLLARGADINDYDGTTALRVAVDMGNLSMVEYLLAAGADPNLYGHGSTPILMLAVKRQELPLVKRLLVAGARPDDKNILNGSTPLSLAHALGATEIETLLKTHSSQKSGIH